MSGFPIGHWLVVLVVFGLFMMLLARSDEVGPSLKRTISGVMDFRGRSAPRDVLYFCLAWMIFAGLTDGVMIQTVENFRARIVAREGVNVLFVLPVFALLARRLHDHNRTALWALVFPIPVVVHLDKGLQHAFVGAHGGPPAPLLPDAATWVVLPILIALVFAVLLPGTIGPNRYGPDPLEGGPS